MLCVPSMFSLRLIWYVVSDKVTVPVFRGAFSSAPWLALARKPNEPFWILD